MRNNKGQFTKGNKAALKQKVCPYCNNELDIQNYTYIKRKTKPTD
jgi:hypothetical protein